MTTSSNVSASESNASAVSDDAQDIVDTSDVPRVGTRELALALKMLSGRGLLVPAAITLSDQALRQVEQAFWQVSRRERQRKVAVLLRFRSFVEACQSRRVAELFASHGQAAVVQALEIAASMRLNAKWGFNPHKMARAMSEALSHMTDARAGAAAAA